MLNKIKAEIIGIILFICWLVTIFSVLHTHHGSLIGIGMLLLMLARMERAWNGSSSPSKGLASIFIHALAILIPISLLWLLYSDAINAWWFNDDPQLLWLTIQNGIWPHFYDPTTWRVLSAANLTPWVNLSLGVDWSLFGLNPKAFYWHHLLSFSVVIVLAYWVLRSFFSPFIISIILCLFIASVSSGVVVQLLMNRHYLEGLGLSLLAFGFYLKALRSDNLIWAVVGSFFYLLATTAKEIYVPLVVVLPFLPINTLKQRWKMLIPFVLVAGLYVIWRIYMLTLESTFAGYGDLASKPSGADTFKVLVHAAELMGWNSLWQPAIFMLFLFIYLFVLYKQIRTSWEIFPLLWLIVVIIPIIPVVTILDPRYLFLPYFMLCLVFGYVLRFFIVQDNRFSYPIVVFLSLFLLMAGLRTVETSFLWGSRAHLQRHAVEGNFILRGSKAEAVLLEPISPYASAFYWLRKQVLKLPLGPKMCANICVCKAAQDVYKYSYESNSIVPVQPSSYNGTECDMTKALTAEISYVNGAAKWQFGPYEKGQYYIFLDTLAFSPISAKGKIKIDLKEPMRLKIRYVSPEGWDTFSPLLNFELSEVDANGVAKLNWQREGK